MDENAKILYRLYGNQKTSDLWPVVDPKWKKRFVILTTIDFGDQNVKDLQDAGFEVVPPKFTTEQANQNSAAFLNDGMIYLKEKGYDYALLMASGFQSNIEWVSNLFKNALREHPGMDIYFALTEYVNDIDYEFLKKKEFNLYENRRRFIPSESLALVRIQSVYPLDEELTTKGNLGKTKDGTPLGGIELMLTIMKKFRNDDESILNMCALRAPIQRKLGKFREFLDERSHIEFEMPGPVEFTPMEVKLARREATIDAAMQKLRMSTVEYGELFSRTDFIDGTDYVHGLLSPD